MFILIIHWYPGVLDFKYTITSTIFREKKFTPISDLQFTAQPM